MDQYIQSQLLVAALNITVKLLKQGGNFVAKIFKGSEIGLLYSQFKLYFREIHIFKLAILNIGPTAAGRAVQSIS
jgi:tRNA (cytidine32/guanosine34-2'-O)-methyltransferase